MLLAAAAHGLSQAWEGVVEASGIGGPGAVYGEGEGVMTADGQNYCPRGGGDFCAAVVIKDPEFGDLYDADAGALTKLPRPRSALTPGAGFKDPIYRNRFGTDHMGVDMTANWGEPISAVADGNAYYGYNKSYGTYIRLVHADGRVNSYYAHISEYNVLDGAAVRAGQVIGRVGCNGRCTGAHIHFAVIVRHGQYFVDPLTGRR